MSQENVEVVKSLFAAFASRGLGGRSQSPRMPIKIALPSSGGWRESYTGGLSGEPAILGTILTRLGPEGLQY